MSIAGTFYTTKLIEYNKIHQVMGSGIHQCVNGHLYPKLSVFGFQHRSAGMCRP